MKRKLFAFAAKRPAAAGGWRVNLAAIAAVGGLFSLYGWRLGAHVPASAYERATIAELQTGINGIDLILLPYKVLAWLYLQLPGSDLTNVRLASATLMCLSIALFFTLARRWHGTLVSAAGTILFAASSWSLHTGRQATAYVSVTVTILALLACAAWVNKSDRHNLVLACYAIACLLAILTPGGIWLALITSLVVFRPLAKHIKAAKNSARLFAAALLSLGLAGIIAACVTRPANIYQALAIPKNLPQPAELFDNALLAASSLVVRGPDTPTSWLAQSPLLDIASSALALLGAFMYFRHIRNSRTHLLLGIGALGILLIVLNGASGLHYITPIVYLLISSGIAYLLHKWRGVFPRNPVADSTALALIGLLVVAIVGFHYQRYFVAWRYSPESIAGFRSEATGPPPAVPYLIQ